VKFTVDQKMTNALDEGGLAELNRQINALLQKGGYPQVANLQW